MLILSTVERHSISAPVPAPTQRDENETEIKDSKSSSPATFRRSSTQTSDTSSTTSFFTSNNTMSTPTSSTLTPSSISTTVPLASAQPSSLLIPSCPEPPEPPVETQAVLDTYLAQGRLDPFKIFPVENVPIYVQEIIDHGTFARLLSTMILRIFSTSVFTSSSILFHQHSCRGSLARSAIPSSLLPDNPTSQLSPQHTPHYPPTTSPTNILSQQP
jgi:hypothetical protein